LLFDRAYGRPITPIETMGEAPHMIVLDCDHDTDKQYEKQLTEQPDKQG